MRFRLAGLVIAGAVAGAPALEAQELYSLRLDGSGQLPASVQVLRGTLSVVTKNGVPMLRATTPVEFVVPLPAALPQNFTIEFDLIPKGCCQPEDLAFEGTARLARTTASAHILWHPLSLQVMGGGGQDYTTAMPPDLQGVLPGTPTRVVTTFESETIKLYTNGRRLFTLTDRRFARTASLRVFLGGQDAAENAVHLAGLRIIAGVVAPLTTVASRAGTTAQDPAGSTATAPAPLTVAPVSPPTGTITTTPATTPTATVAPRSSAGATTTVPVSTATSTTRPVAGISAPSQPPPPPPPPAPAAAPTPPVGVGEASDLEGQPDPTTEPEETLQAAPTVKSVLTIDGVSFEVFVRRGGSAAAQVLESQATDGTIKKQLSTINFEPLVVDVPPGSPLDAWMHASLTGTYLRKNGSLSGGTIPAGQQLEFRDALITAVTVPVLDVTNSNPAYLRVTIAPEEFIQTALTTPVTGTTTSWQGQDFRFSMGSLETGGISRIEALTGALEMGADATGTQRLSTATPARRTVSNLRLTLAADGANSATNWLAWFDDFVLKGNNGDDRERTFTLELGIGKRTDQVGAQRTYAPGNLLNLKGSGVGIIAIRTLPQAAPTTVRLLQIDLYIERLEVVP